VTMAVLPLSMTISMKDKNRCPHYPERI